MRRRIKPGFVSGFFEDRFQKKSGGAFSFGSRDKDGKNFFFRMTEAPQKKKHKALVSWPADVNSPLFLGPATPYRFKASTDLIVKTSTMTF